MSTTTKKRSVRLFPSAKIRRAVGQVLPKGQRFQLKIADSSIGKMKIVRVVTPAWKTLRPSARIAKVLDAVSGELTPSENNRILRFSVLTPDEYKRVVSPGQRTKSSAKAVALAGS
jgi:hypothetical protein